jgi:hypothetical protein
LINPDGSDSNVTASPNLSVAVTPNSVTGVSTSLVESQLFLQARSSNATPGDQITLTATFTDADGTVYTSTLGLSVEDPGQQN